MDALGAQPSLNKLARLLPSLRTRGSCYQSQSRTTGCASDSILPEPTSPEVPQDPRVPCACFHEMTCQSKTHRALWSKEGASASSLPGSSAKAPINITERSFGPSPPHPSFIRSMFCLLIFIQKMELPSWTELGWRVFGGTVRLTSVARLPRWPRPRVYPLIPTRSPPTSSQYNK